MPFLTLLLLAGMAQAQYQICLQDKVAFFMSAPEEEWCVVPEAERAVKIEKTTLFLPVVIPRFVEAHHCYNLTTIVCTKAYLFWRDVQSRREVRTPVTPEQCRRMAEEKRAPSGERLVARSEVEMGTTGTATPEYSVMGEHCTAHSNYYILKGHVGARYGRRLISELDDLTDCEVKEINCTRSSGVTVWTALPETFYCTHRPVEEQQTVMMSEKRVIIESSHAGWYISENQTADRTKACVPEQAVKLDGDAFLLVPEHSTKFRRRREVTPRPARRWSTTTIMHTPPSTSTTTTSTTTTQRPTTTSTTTTTTTTTMGRTITTITPPQALQSTPSPHTTPRLAHRWVTSAEYLWRRP